ncbi:MAG: hypothetical protein ACR2M5_05430 [Nakamurella sp.]
MTKKLALSAAAMVAVVGAIVLLPSALPIASSKATHVASSSTPAASPTRAGPSKEAEPSTASAPPITVPALTRSSASTAAPSSAADAAVTPSAQPVRTMATSSTTSLFRPRSKAGPAASAAPTSATPSVEPLPRSTTHAATASIARPEVPPIPSASASSARPPIAMTRSSPTSRPVTTNSTNSTASPNSTVGINRRVPITRSPSVRKPALSTPPSTTAVSPTTRRPAPRPAPQPAPTPAPAPRPSPAPSFGIGVDVGNATQIITVAAGSNSSTTGSLRAWQKQSNGSWRKVYGPVTAHLGQDGVGSPSENSSRTPQGTWGVTEGFGRSSNPGTSMPYSRVGDRDWWVSDPNSSRYNTHQICSADSCPFDTAAGENLYRAGSVYDYAMVMDVNRWPATAGGGSAFFLHVTNGGPTAGCVSIDAGTLISIMRWLKPSGHPRIAVGIS